MNEAEGQIKPTPVEFIDNDLDDDTDFVADASSPHKAQGIKRVINACGYSLEGIGAAFKHEAAFRQEIYLALVLIPLAILLPVGMLGKVCLIGSLFAVMIVELLNSALEWIVDYISLDRHPMAKRAKDMGSGAVMLALLNCGLIWATVIAFNWSAIGRWLS